jgi:multiple sugar transport system substrate-binding protein
VWMSNRRRVIGLIMGLALALGAILPCWALAAEQLELNVWITPESGNFEWVMTGIEEWKVANPQYRDVKINTGTGWLNVLRTHWAGGMQYDVIMYSSSDIPGMVYNGMLADLGPYLQTDPSSGALVRTMIPSTVENLRYKDRLYGLPRFWSSVAVVYNLDLFDKRGVPLPQESWTQDDIIRMGKKLTHDSNGDGYIDVWAWSEPWMSHHRWPYWVWSNGGEFYNASLTESLLAEEKAIQGVEKMISLYTEHGVGAKILRNTLAEPGLASEKTGHSIAPDLFQRSATAMFLTTRIGVPPGLNFRFGVLPLPWGAVSRTSVLVTNFLGIGQQTKHPQMAWSLLKFLVSEPGYMAGFNDSVRFMTSANLKLAQREVVRDAPERDPMYWITAADDARRADILHPIGQIQVPWDNIISGLVSVRQALQTAVTTHNAMLKERYAQNPW